MVSTRGVRYKFSEGERVLCYEPDPTKAKVLYDSKVLGIIENKDKRGRRTIEYLIHFQGWNSSWDRCVGEDFVLKDTEENRQLQRDLAEKSQLQLGAYLYRRERKKGSTSGSGGGSAAKRPRHRLSDDGSSSSTQPDEPEGDEAEDRKPEIAAAEKSQESPVQEIKSPVQKIKEEIESESSESSEDEPVVQPSVEPDVFVPVGRAHLTMPAALRDRLTFDYHLIVKRNRLTRLPASPCAAQILESFVKWFARAGAWNTPRCRNEPPQKPDLADVSRRLNLVREVADGLRVYFDFILRGNLLYKPELAQYHQVCGQFIDLQERQMKEEVESDLSQDEYEDEGASAEEDMKSPKIPEYSHLPPDPVQASDIQENGGMIDVSNIKQEIKLEPEDTEEEEEINDEMDAALQEEMQEAMQQEMVVMEIKQEMPDDVMQQEIKEEIEDQEDSEEDSQEGSQDGSQEGSQDEYQDEIQEEMQEQMIKEMQDRMQEELQQVIKQEIHQIIPKELQEDILDEEKKDQDQKKEKIPGKQELSLDEEIKAVKDGKHAVQEGEKPIIIKKEKEDSNDSQSSPSARMEDPEETTEITQPAEQVQSSNEAVEDSTSQVIEHPHTPKPCHLALEGLNHREGLRSQSTEAPLRESPRSHSTEVPHREVLRGQSTEIPHREGLRSQLTEGPSRESLRSQSTEGPHREGLRSQSTEGPYKESHHREGLRSQSTEVPHKEGHRIQSTEGTNKEGTHREGLRSQSIEDPNKEGIRSQSTEVPHREGLRSQSTEIPHREGLRSQSTEGPHREGLHSQSTEGSHREGLRSHSTEAPHREGLRSQSTEDPHSPAVEDSFANTVRRKLHRPNTRSRRGNNSPAAVGCNSPAVGSNSPAVESNSPAVGSNSPAIDRGGNSPAVGSKSPAIDRGGNSPAVGSNSPAIDRGGNSPAVGSKSPAIDRGGNSPAVGSNSPAIDRGDTSPAIEDFSDRLTADDPHSFANTVRNQISRPATRGQRRRWTNSPATPPVNEEAPHGSHAVIAPETPVSSESKHEAEMATHRPATRTRTRSCHRKSNNSPAINSPVVNSSAVNSPAANSPTINSPAATSPAVKSPAAHSPAVNSAAANSPAVKSPAAHSPAVNSAAVNSPAVNSPDINSPAVNSPAVNSPAVNSPAVNSPEALESSNATDKAHTLITDIKQEPREPETCRPATRSGNVARRLRSHKSTVSQSENEEPRPSTSTAEQRTFEHLSSMGSGSGSSNEEWSKPAEPAPISSASTRTPLSLLLDKVSKYEIIPREGTEHLPCRVYGAIHLARLFVRLPDFLNATQMSDFKLKLVVKHIDMFIQYLVEHKEWFGEKFYYCDSMSRST